MALCTTTDKLKTLTAYISNFLDVNTVAVLHKESRQLIKSAETLVFQSESDNNIVPEPDIDMNNLMAYGNQVLSDDRFLTSMNNSELTLAKINEQWDDVSSEFRRLQNEENGFFGLRFQQILEYVCDQLANVKDRLLEVRVACDDLTQILIPQLNNLQLLVAHPRSFEDVKQTESKFQELEWQFQNAQTEYDKAARQGDVKSLDTYSESRIEFLEMMLKILNAKFSMVCAEKEWLASQLPQTEEKRSNVDSNLNLLDQRISNLETSYKDELLRLKCAGDEMEKLRLNINVSELEAIELSNIALDENQQCLTQTWKELANLEQKAKSLVLSRLSMLSDRILLTQRRASERVECAAFANYYESRQTCLQDNLHAASTLKECIVTFRQLSRVLCKETSKILSNSCQDYTDRCISAADLHNETFSKFHMYVDLLVKKKEKAREDCHSKIQDSDTSSSQQILALELIKTATVFADEIVALRKRNSDMALSRTTLGLGTADSPRVFRAPSVVKCQSLSSTSLLMKDDSDMTKVNLLAEDGNSDI